MPSVVVRRVVNIGNWKDTSLLLRDVGFASKRILEMRRTIYPRVAQNLRLTVAYPLTRSLRKYPPRKPGMKIRWTSEKQRRAYFATDGFGGGIPYTRTGKLAAGWSVKVDVQDRTGAIRMSVTNKAERNPAYGTGTYFQFAQGFIGLGKSGRTQMSYRRPMQGFHKDRGWQEAAPKVADAFEKARARGMKELQKHVQQTIKGLFPD